MSRAWSAVIIDAALILRARAGVQTMPSCFQAIREPFCHAGGRYQIRETSPRNGRRTTGHLDATGSNRLRMALVALSMSLTLRQKIASNAARRPSQ